MTEMILGPCETVNFTEDVYVIENPRPITNRVCTSTPLCDVTYILINLQDCSMLNEVLGVWQTKLRSINVMMT